MPKIYLLIATFFIALLICSCSKKHHPSRTVENNSSTTKINDSLNAKKLVVRPKPKDIIPKAIVVNDSVAHKSIDGRLYYDLIGHRYWKNYKDGKYYLYNKSMYTNDAFKPK